MNKLSRIGPHNVLQSSSIDTVFYLLVKNNKGRGGWVGFKTEGGLLLKLSSFEKEGLLERGRLNRGFKILLLLFLLPLRCKKNEKCFHYLQYSNPKYILNFELDLIFRANTFLIPDYGLFYI